MVRRIGITEIKRDLDIELGGVNRPNSNHTKQVRKAVKGILKRIYTKDIPYKNMFFGVTIADKEGTEFFLNMGNLDPRTEVDLKNVEAWVFHVEEWLQEYYLNVQEEFKAKYATRDPVTGEIEQEEFDWAEGIKIVEIQGKAVYQGDRDQITAYRRALGGRNSHHYYLRLDKG